MFYQSKNKEVRLTLYLWTLNYSKDIFLYAYTHRINSFSSSFIPNRSSQSKEEYLLTATKAFQRNPVANARWFTHTTMCYHAKSDFTINLSHLWFKFICVFYLCHLILGPTKLIKLLWWQNQWTNNKTKTSHLSFEKCDAKLHSIFCALQNCIFFHCIYQFLRNIDKTQAAILKFSAPAIITSREMIERYDAIFDQSERANLYIITKAIKSYYFNIFEEDNYQSRNGILVSYV